MHDISTHEQWFAGFIEQYRQKMREDVLPINLKDEHSAAVLAHARVLVEEEAFPAPLGRACLLAALYHDVARFPQYARWRTFKDSLSVNHGLLGVKVLRQHDRLASEEPRVRALVLAAVGMHNRFAVPQGLAPDVRLVVDVVRDADKLDIFRVMAQHLNAAVPAGDVVLHVKNEPEHWTPAVAETILRGEVPSYGDLHYINDFRMLLVSWFHDLGFACSRNRLAHSGHVEPVLTGLPDHPDLAPARDNLWQLLERAR